MSNENPHTDNTGVLFFNSEEWRMEKPGRPEYTGEATVNGVRLRVAAWDKISKKTGKQFISLAFSIPQNDNPKPEQRKGGK